jgi:hypothetical protein
LGKEHELLSSSLSISILLLFSVCWFAVSPQNFVFILRVRYQVRRLYKMTGSITVLYVVLLKRDSKCDTHSFCVRIAQLENRNQYDMWHLYPSFKWELFHCILDLVLTANKT